MGAGILMSRDQANAAMAAARARSAASGNCGPCPPSPTNGGVTGRQPASGPSPTNGGPSPRQDELHPREPAGQVARDTGNNPCGGNGNSSSNIANQGYTQNPNVIPVAASRLASQPVSPYELNPLESPPVAPGGQPATDGGGLPTPASQSGGQPCPPCDMNPTAEYDRGYDLGQAYGPSGIAERGLPGPEAFPGASPSYVQGFQDGALGRPRLVGGRRPASRYNLRRGPASNVRRVVRRYV
jgi:hypothetical protein